MTFLKFKNIFFLFLSLSIMHCNNNGIYDLINSTTNSYGGTKKVFVTSIGTAGDLSFQANASISTACFNLSGIPKANCACQTLASQAGLANSGQIFKAWLSDSVSGIAAVCNIIGVSSTICSSSSSANYVDINGNVLYNTWSDIYNAAWPMTTISVTELRGAPPLSTVWTGTMSTGKPAGSDCNYTGAWTDNGAFLMQGTIGNTNYFDSNWTEDFITAPTTATQGCGTVSPIYCFEQ